MTITRLAFFKWLAAAVGIGQATVINKTVPTGQTNVIQTSVEGPFSDGQGGCFTNRRHILGDIKRVPCKEGEEYCPLGHSQKPGLFIFLETVERSLRQMHICSVCGIVYVPIAAPKEK